MQPRKLNVHFAWFTYGGNGGIASANPWLRPWFHRAMTWLKNDPRVGEITESEYCDTPITMVRNRCVLDARQAGADILVMIDSDNVPDHYLHSKPGAKPFMPTTFDFMYRHYDRGPTVVAAPYCGPPPEELVYVFDWTNKQSDYPGADYSLMMVARPDAARRGGIMEAAALATGVSAWDLRGFAITEPKKKGDRAWFEYEYEDIFQAYKCSTEDVMASRELSLAVQVKLGYNPLFCNWDAWAGHLKAKMVGPPIVPTVDTVSKIFVDAVHDNLRGDERLVNFGDADFDPARHPPEPAHEPVHRNGHGVPPLEREDSVCPTHR